MRYSAAVQSGAAVLILLFASHLTAQQAAADPALERRITDLLERLDSDRFEVRSRAADELESLVARPEAAEMLAARFQRALADPAASFEVRSRLRLWLKRLPAVEVDGPPDASEIDQLVEAVLGDSFAQRTGATQRVKRLASQPPAAIALLTRLRSRLADPDLSAADYDRLLQLEQYARGVWLLSDPTTWKLPAVSDGEIGRALGELTQSPPSWHKIGAFRPHAAARRYLLDLLCRDDVLPRVKQALETALTPQSLDDAARARLTEIQEWTRPAMVAEIWMGRRHIAEQHLYVDVPRQSNGASRPSHFSRIDDRTAWCVSGQNLRPGEYPVGVAIPHPERHDWMCHLVNVPTPLRRLRYTHQVLRDEQQRLSEITQRTFKTHTVDGTYLTDQQILLFHQLHLATVSRLAGDYFLAVDDRRQDQDANPSLSNLGNASHHARMCYVLALMGTRDVATGLLDALRKQRFLPPVRSEAPYDWPWIAALTIADRDPWPDVDQWLSTLLDRREPLIAGAEPEDETNRGAARSAATPELGATAAALLLERHQQQVGTFGLEEVPNSMLRNVGCAAYRFTASTGRQQVLAWWENQRRQQAQREKSP